MRNECTTRPSVSSLVVKKDVLQRHVIFYDVRTKVFISDISVRDLVYIIYIPGIYSRDLVL